MNLFLRTQSKALAGSSGGTSLQNSWDPAKTNPNDTLSNSNKTVARTGANGWAMDHAVNPQPINRKSVWEVRMDSFSTGTMVGFSIKNPLTAYTSGYFTNTDTGGIYWMNGQAGLSYSGTNVTKNAASLGKAAEAFPGDIFAFGYDPVAGTIVMWKNGLPLNSGNPVFTVAPNKLVYPTACFYGAGNGTTIRSGAGELKYTYGAYSVAEDGGIAPGQGTRFWDASMKPSGVTLYDSDRQAVVTTDLGTSYTSYATSILPNTKKSVVEFLVTDIGKYNIVGLSFETGRTGPKAGVLGTLAYTLGVELAGANNGKIYGANCARNLTTFGTNFFANGDVLAIGFDPTLKVAHAWKNGVALNSGNPVWTSMIANDCTPAYTLAGLGGRVRLSNDLPTYNYGAFTN